MREPEAFHIQATPAAAGESLVPGLGWGQRPGAISLCGPAECSNPGTRNPSGPMCIQEARPGCNLVWVSPLADAVPRLQGHNTMDQVHIEASPPARTDVRVLAKPMYANHPFVDAATAPVAIRAYNDDSLISQACEGPI